MARVVATPQNIQKTVALVPVAVAVAAAPEVVSLALRNPAATATVMNALTEGAPPIAATAGATATVGAAARMAEEPGPAVTTAAQTFHRLENASTQTPATAAAQQASGEIWGRTPRGGMEPTVQAYAGPLPQGARGVEFTTDVPPSAVNTMNGEARWYQSAPGVESRTANGNDYAAIKCTVTANTQC